MREDLLAAYRAALRAVDPAASVFNALELRGSTLYIRRRRLDLAGGLKLLSLGKAAVGMATGAIAALGDAVDGGIVVSTDLSDLPSTLEGVVGDHPLPGAASLKAGERLLSFVESCEMNDTLLFLISGGGSSLAEVPAQGTSIDTLAETQRALMASGAPIEDLNLVRRHMSAIKNGGLLAATKASTAITLLISDVAHGSRSDIASGPTLRNDSTPESAQEVIETRLGNAPIVTANRLQGRADKPDHHYHVIEVVADGAIAAEGARQYLARGGHPTRVMTTNHQGEARIEAVCLVNRPRSGVLIVAGETTVSGATSGSGGRNQEAALAAAIALNEKEAGVFAALGTDGVDGNTDAAGAIVDCRTLTRGIGKGLSADVYLRSHNSHIYLAETGDLVTTGPTGTNVGDLWMVA